MAHEHEDGEIPDIVVVEDASDSSLVPMLVAGLVLIVIAMFGALLFV